MNSQKISVLLATEGTYPFHQGGVSTWCETLVNKVEQVDYVVYSVIMNPFVTQKFKLPAGTKLVSVPLWGTEEPSEHLSTPFATIYAAKRRTDEEAVRREFVPLFTALIEEILSPVKDHQRFGAILVQLYDFFQHYDYKASFKSEATWEMYKELVLKRAAQNHFGLSQPDVYGLIQSLGWVYRFLNIVNTEVPETHVTHSSAAAFCSIPCVIAKIKRQTPFMLTEHGVYLREQYLSLGQRQYSSFLSAFLMRFIHSISGLSYAYADQVSPVCHYNTRWETRFGVPRKRIEVIYNGVDQGVFTEAPRVAQTQPTVVMVARIMPVKDVLTFIRSAALVRQQIPNVKFVLYGSVGVQSYYEECLQEKDRLSLGDTVVFAGHTSNMAAAYRSGDIIALSSISEAFPYTVVEAMMSGKPVVSTDVGGVREALGDTGLLVTPRSPDELARELIKLLQDQELREELGSEARQRALNYFTLERMIDLHLRSYIQLASGAEERLPLGDRDHQGITRQKFLMEKGVLLMEHGLYQQAVEQFQAALREKPDSPLAPVLLGELSKAYNHLGQYDRSLLELERSAALMDALAMRGQVTA
ncbi:MAG TPA: GT4 family glycosyltransferase PelF [Bacilli bacterium]|nr:GT4 family glycosyltransferase PelF [Bacilli bacterium]